MKPTPEFENAMCRVWKMNLMPDTPLSLWTNIKDSLLISQSDVHLAYQLPNGTEDQAQLKAHHPWGFDEEHSSLVISNPGTDPLFLMLVELKRQSGSFPSIPIH
jgi:hypothetical protein